MNYKLTNIEANKYITEYYNQKLEFTILNNKIYSNNTHIGTWDYNNNQILWIGHILTPLVGRSAAWEWFHELNASLCKIIPKASDMACLSSFINLNQKEFT